MEYFTFSPGPGYDYYFKEEDWFHLYLAPEVRVERCEMVRKILNEGKKIALLGEKQFEEWIKTQPSLKDLVKKGNVRIAETRTSQSFS